MKCYWFCTIGTDLLFIFPNGSIFSWEKKQYLIKVRFRGRFYYKHKGTSIRIAQSTLKRNAEKCNVIL